MPHFEITEVVLAHCNVGNHNYQENARVLNIFVPNKSCGLLLHNSPKNFIFSMTFSSEFSYIEVWFTDQSSKALGVEDKLNTILVINQSAT